MSRGVMSDVDRRIIPVPFRVPESEREHERMWGFADSGFALSGGTLTLRGARYESSGVPLPAFLPFVTRAVGVSLDPGSERQLAPLVVPEGPDVSELVHSLESALGAEHVSIDGTARVRRGHGHHLEEIYEVLFGALERVPDVVVFPSNDDDVQKVLALAARFGARVVPYGGGTTVSGSLTCTPGDVAIVSLDLSRMSRVLWIDPVTRTASIEGGAVGRHIDQELRRHGFVLGHEPDSIEFSTLGGWIATNASGMKKNRYGNIEDIVLDVTIVDAGGVVEHPAVVPRASHGIDARRLAFGSEGQLGVITRAVVKLHPAPEVQRYGSLVFPDFRRGLAFMEEVATWQLLPASIRLVDNLQFQFGQAMKPAGSPFKKRIQKLVLTRLKGIDLEKMVACTLVYEGDREEMEALASRVDRTAKKYGGFSAGSDNGKTGYNLTFGIAYIRDFLLRYWTLGDSFETSVPWGKVDAVIEGVRKAVVAAHQRAGLPGHAFVTARVSQIYPTGCCVYFYIGFNYRGVEDPLGAFRDIEHDARVAILEAGGALSHHHGIGKVRAPYLAEVKSERALAWVASVRAALDPAGTFQTGNQLPKKEQA